MGQPADDPRQGEEKGEEVSGEAHGTVDEARVKVDVRIELALDKVIVSQSNSFELHGNLNQGLIPTHLKDLVGDLADDPGAGIKVAIDSMPKAHQLLLLALHSRQEIWDVGDVPDLLEHL